MSEQHPTPQWYTPSGGTTTAPRHDGAGAPTTAMPVRLRRHSPADGPASARSASPLPQAPAPKPAKRGVGQLTAVAVLAALLASGGTVAAAHYWTTTPGRRDHLLDHPARQQRLGAGQAGHRVRARLDRHGIRRLAERRQHHRHPGPGWGAGLGRHHRQDARAHQQPRRGRRRRSSP